ncbi:MAG: hypothetical protein R3E95_14455 [Thiolinea sp.]
MALGGQLFFGVAAGSMDSAQSTPLRRPQKSARMATYPRQCRRQASDRASLVYSQRCKETLPAHPGNPRRYRSLTAP